jgi:twitching motility protein PilT
MHKAELDRLLTYAVQKDASDIHLCAGSPPLLRIHGSLRRLDTGPLRPESLRQLFDEILNTRQKEKLRSGAETDFAYHVPEVARFRANVYLQMRGEAVAFRVIPDRVRTLEELGCPQGIYTLARAHKGLVLVTGPTGSGKSTTLAAMIDLINQERYDHIVTIEDPIEYVHRSKNCLINQRQLGDHTTSFAAALRAALREDPDVILVGEMRDLETISLALTAAETGHLVLATLHTMSAAETVNRVVDVFPPEQQRQVRAMFANSCQGVVAQKLLPTQDGRGRVAAHEILIATPAVRNLIREEKTHQIGSAIQTGGAAGMQTLDAAVKDLYKRGIISRQVAEANLEEGRLL